MEPQPPAEEEEQAPVPESAEPAPELPSPMDMVKRYALPVVFVLAVWLGLSNIGARFVCKLCTEPAIDSLFIDEEALGVMLDVSG